MQSFQGCRIHSIREDLRLSSEAAARRQENGKKKWFRIQAKKKAWMDAEHHFRLKIGDTLVWLRCVMIGREAYTRNVALEKEFIRDLDRNGKVRPRLQRWCLDSSKETKV